MVSECLAWGTALQNSKAWPVLGVMAHWEGMGDYRGLGTFVEGEVRAGWNVPIQWQGSIHPWLDP